MRKLKQCCKKEIRQLLDDIGATLGEYHLTPRLFWAFRQEWLGETVPDYVKTDAEEELEQECKDACNTIISYVQENNELKETIEILQDKKIMNRFKQKSKGKNIPLKDMKKK